MYRIVKRSFDICASCIAMIVLLPLFAIIAMLIYHEDRGRVFFSQKRVGKDGKLFQMYKFRSMIPDAEKMRSALEKYNELDGAAFKMKHDPRVTKIGRFIRRTSIDELPQLVNVLRGEMSLVGPRPLPAYESEKLTPVQLQRLNVLPGLTCYWQASGRSDIAFDEWMEMDRKYVQEAGITTDFRILLRTVKTVLSGKGAY